jgi:hypothetical protein
MKEERNCFQCVFSEPMFINDIQSEKDKLKNVCICHQISDYVKIETANMCNKFKKPNINLKELKQNE